MKYPINSVHPDFKVTFWISGHKTRVPGLVVIPHGRLAYQLLHIASSTIVLGDIPTKELALKAARYFRKIHNWELPLPEPIPQGFREQVIEARERFLGEHPKPDEIRYPHLIMKNSMEVTR